MKPSWEKILNKVLSLLVKIKSYFYISDKDHKRLLEFLGQDPNQKFEELTGTVRQEYKRYKKWFSRQESKSKSFKLPFIPNIFKPKMAVPNLQGAINYFQSLYSAEAEKELEKNND